MTKVTILGEQPQETKKKQIEFIGCIQYDGKGIIVTSEKPSFYDEIILLPKSNNSHDLFLAIRGNDKFYFTGYFNDGIV